MKNLALFLLVLFVIAALLRVDFFFTILYLLFAVYLLSRWWTGRAIQGLRVQRQFVDHAFLGDRVTVSLTVRQTGRLPIPWLELHESLPVNLASPPFHREVVSLGARQERRLNYRLECRKRGYYPIGPLTLRSGDLLGTVRPSPTQLAPNPLVVYPRVVPLHKLGLPTHSPLAVLPARSPLFEDPAKIMGVRDYAVGDSPRRIHWTATASAGRLLVKRYQPAISRETLICLDLDVSSYDVERQYTAVELAIVVAASIATHIVVNEKLPAGLATEAWDPVANDRARFFIPPRAQRAGLTSVLEVLARVEVAQVTPLPDLLRHESARMAWGATLAVITGRETGALFETLLYLRRAGFAVSLILVQPPRAPEEVRRQADMSGVPIHQVWVERDLELVR